MGSDWDNFTRLVSTKSLEQFCNKEYIKFDGMKSMFLGRSEQDLRWDIHGGSEVPENKKSNKSCFSRLQKAFQTHSQKFIYLFFTCFANIYILQQVFTKGTSIVSQSVPTDERTYQKNLNEIPQNGHYS